MNILLDTHVFIWWVRNSARLGKQARMLIQDQETRIWVSCASIWEISIKAALGRLDVLDPLWMNCPVSLRRAALACLQSISTMPLPYGRYHFTIKIRSIAC